MSLKITQNGKLAHFLDVPIGGLIACEFQYFQVLVSFSVYFLVSTIAPYGASKEARNNEEIKIEEQIGND